MINSQDQTEFIACFARLSTVVVLDLSHILIRIITGFIVHTLLLSSTSLLTKGIGDTGILSNIRYSPELQENLMSVS